MGGWGRGRGSDVAGGLVSSSRVETRRRGGEAEAEAALRVRGRARHLVLLVQRREQLLLFAQHVGRRAGGGRAGAGTGGGGGGGGARRRRLGLATGLTFGRRSCGPPRPKKKNDGEERREAKSRLLLVL